MWKRENKVDELLKELNIPTLSVSYDTLFYPDTKSEGEREWNRMLRFARGGPVNDNGSINSAGDGGGGDWKTWSEIQKSMGFTATTSSRNHKDLLSNWEEVRDRFNGTVLESFLRI